MFAIVLTAAMKPTLSHVILSRGKGVTAVTSLGDDVFVVRDDYWSSAVEVYDARTFTFQRYVKIPELGKKIKVYGLSVYGLTACAHYKIICLYVSDSSNSSIHRAELSSSKAVKKWFVTGKPRGLSVNKALNVVVACYGANKLLEYTTRGDLVREISLQAGVTLPWHAVQLSTGDYVVSQNTPSGKVSVVGVDGQVLRSSDVTDMSYPRSLAVTKYDDILVADTNNNRILSMNSSLSSVEHLSLPVDHGLQQPSGLYLSRGRLYVGEGSGKYRVLVFNNAKL